VWGILFIGGGIGGYIGLDNYYSGQNPPQEQPGWVKPAAGALIGLGAILFIYGVASNDSMDIKAMGEGAPNNLGRSPPKKMQVGLDLRPIPGGGFGGATVRF
jgi:hypothetical protein